MIGGDTMDLTAVEATEPLYVEMVTTEQAGLWPPPGTDAADGVRGSSINDAAAKSTDAEVAISSRPVAACAVVPLVARPHGAPFMLMEQLVPIVKLPASFAAGADAGSIETEVQRLLEDGLHQHRATFRQGKALNDSQLQLRTPPVNEAAWKEAKGLANRLSVSPQSGKSAKKAAADSDIAVQQSEQLQVRSALVEWLDGTVGCTCDVAGIIEEQRVREVHHLHLVPLTFHPLSSKPAADQASPWLDVRQRCREQLRRLEHLKGIATSKAPHLAEELPRQKQRLDEGHPRRPVQVAILSARPQYRVMGVSLTAGPKYGSGSQHHLHHHNAYRVPVPTSNAAMTFLAQFDGQPHGNRFMTVGELVDLLDAPRGGSPASGAAAPAPFRRLPPEVREMVSVAAVVAMQELLGEFCDAMSLILRCRRGGALKATQNQTLLETLVWYERQPPAAEFLTALVDDGVFHAKVREEDFMPPSFWEGHLPQWEEARLMVLNNGRVLTYKEVSAMFALAGIV